MCGIFGYRGDRDAVNIVFEGLKTLEYRGYDSWGITWMQDNKLSTLKEIGKLPTSIPQQKKSSLAIGHTRWATHGGITHQNAHPHPDCTGKIAVIHNGIIENYSNLKANLILKGHVFLSETDTEVFPHLIEELVKKMPFELAVRKAFSELEGLNAFVILNSNDNKLHAIKNGSPMVIGAGGKGEYFVASDSAGIMKYTDNVLFVEDNVFLTISNTISATNAAGQNIKLKFQKYQWKKESPSKGKYEHFLIKEIADQPKCIQRISEKDEGEITAFADSIRKAFGTYLIGCGTASYAALAGQYLFSTIAHKHVNFSVGSEFSYLQDFLIPKSVILAISQSGETIDVIDPVTKAKKIGSKILSITNGYGSTLFRASDQSLLLDAGPEVAVVGTKSYTAMVALLLLLSYELKGDQNQGKVLLKKAARDISHTLTQRLGKVKEASKIVSESETVFTIGRGISYALALESALKIKETSLIHAEGFAGGELKHGVMALIQKGTPCVVFAPNDETLNDILSNAQEIKTRGGFMIGVGPVKSGIFDLWIETEDLGPATILSQVVIAQLLAYYAALERGIEDPDKPRNLAKSVTVK